MASEPYLMSRKTPCYKAPASYSYNPRLPRLDPACVPDKYTAYFRDRWNATRQDTCKCKCPKNLCPARPFSKLSERCPKQPKNIDDTCVTHAVYDRGVSNYQKDYPYPKSHNDVDDCCKPECPCLDTFPTAPQIDYYCKIPSTTEPIEDCTTYKHFYYPKPVPPPPRRYHPLPYDPCECPLESATSYRLDYHLKDPVPNGPALAKAIHRGMWSMDQFCGPFQDNTETNDEFYRKCAYVRDNLKPPDHLKTEGRFEDSTETCSQFNQKCAEDRICIPEWVENDIWVPPDTPLDKCTTYKNFYKPNQIRVDPNRPIKSPDAIPFSSINNMWYSCCDPPVDQRVPVEMRDMDPWPVVNTKPIKYEDNLQADPCAIFRDETIHKQDYTPKKRCAPNKNYRPDVGYTPPILPFNDNTTNRVSYIAFPPELRKWAKQEPGNPCGIRWGPFKCPPDPDKCRPFPAPYGHPLKPYTCQCPCGDFDDRSTYHKFFKFWTPEMVDSVIEEQCKPLNLKKGITSMYRASYNDPGGKKAAEMPPPKCKGQRCMNPCSIHLLDALYRKNYFNYYKSYPRDQLEKYRGHPSITNRRSRSEDDDCPEDQTCNNRIRVYSMPPGTTVAETLKILEEEQKQKQRECANVKCK